MLKKILKYVGIALAVLAGLPMLSIGLVLATIAIVALSLEPKPKEDK